MTFHAYDFVPLVHTLDILCSAKNNNVKNKCTFLDSVVIQHVPFSGTFFQVLYLCCLWPAYGLLVITSCVTLIPVFLCSNWALATEVVLAKHWFWSCINISELSTFQLQNVSTLHAMTQHHILMKSLSEEEDNVFLF